MDKLTVIKVGGKIVEGEETLQQFLIDFAQIDGFKILIHGGGSLATKVATQLGIESKIIDGRRITDEEMLKVVTMVYAGWVNKMIVARLQALGIDAFGLTGADLNLIRSIKRPLQTIDYGFVGDIVEVNSHVLAKLLSQGFVPVIAPLTHDKLGNLLNTNADTIAAETAMALAKLFDVTLIYCFEKRGVLRDEKEEKSVIPLIDREMFKQYKEQGIIQGGMIPKLENAFQAINSGVTKIIITNSSDIQCHKGTVIQSCF